MAGVAEHNAEQKRKRDRVERRRIDLAIIGHAVGVHDVLKGTCEFVCSIERRWFFFGHYEI